MLPPLPPVIPVRELRVVVGVGVRRERFRKGRVGKAVTEGEFVEDKVEVGVGESVTPNTVVKVPREDGAEVKVGGLDGNVEEVVEALDVPVTLTPGEEEGEPRSTAVRKGEEVIVPPSPPFPPLTP